MIGILIVAAVGIIGFLLTAGIAFGIAGRDVYKRQVPILLDY